MHPRLSIGLVGRSLLGAAVLILLGCVISTRHTIDAHIVVDIRHIQQQTEDILDFVEGKTDKPPELAAPGASSWLERGLDAVRFTRVAYAAEGEASSPLAVQILKSMRDRNEALQALKDQGFAGENNRGYVELRPHAALEDAEKKNEAQKVIAAENNDRKALYKELARINADTGATVSTIERVQAQTRLKRAKPGEIFQLPPAGEDFDAFKASEAGKKLGAECLPEAWVTIQ